ncbi:MAG TPA: FtsX-like permease family protein [Chitinophagaceae bacterium]|nr:FtsX-like permease family protein [Chitinophagaceae bacterium]
MIKSYFTIAWRNLIKSQGYSAINIGGLAVGMAVAILIGLWIYDELSFNKYHQNYNRIAQVMLKGNFNGQRFTSSALPRPLEFELRNKYGSPFKNIVMSRWDEEHILSVDDKKISRFGRFMQEGAPEMLSLHMQMGNWSGLKDPHSIMLSFSAAKALFGDEDPINKMMRIDNQMDVKVTGVYSDLPYNSDFKNLKFISSWDLNLSFHKWMQEAKDNWGNSSFLMYVQLQPNTTFNDVNAVIKNAELNVTEEEYKKFHREVFLNPMSRWHLYPQWKDGINVGGRIQYVWMFGIIGAFVLFLACINFMNLSTARSEKRAKEVGIRKAVGSLRSQLIRQFLCESFVIVFISFILSMMLVALSLQLFNQISDKEMTMIWSNQFFWIISAAFIVITSLISGSYPAFYLSSFNPVKVLKGTFQAGRFASLPRKVLVVLQFTVSVVLIIGTIVVYRQLQHAKDRPVGYSRDGLLTIQIKSPDLLQRYDVLSKELENQGIVAEIARSSSPTTAIWSNNGGLEWKDKDPNKVEGFGTIWITHDYGKTVGWEMKKGRDYSPAFASDSIGSASDSTVVYSIIVNEAAVKYMELKEPIGEIIRWSGFQFKIVGVVKDMLMESPFDPVRQTIYLVNNDEANACIHVRINPKLAVGDALVKMESIFKRLVPSVPFDYKFVDTEYGLKFATEERVGKLASVFAVLAIFISCLGLFGLASFIAEKRTKEIGIRKVLGATVRNLWQMLSKDFVVLVVIACCIAAPLAYYFLSQWLQKYEYRTEISWWIFAVAIGGALFITLLTVSFQAIKAAIANPVKSLRTE